MSDFNNLELLKSTKLSNMSNEMQLKLIQTCSSVCELFDKNPQWNFIKLSNNKPIERTDQKLFVYLKYVF